MNYEGNVEQIEESLLQSLLKMKPDSSQNIEIALAYGDQYRKAGLTPCYFLDWDSSLIRVTTDEKMDKKYQ